MRHSSHNRLVVRIQHRSTKLVSSIRYQSYESRLKALDLYTLVERRTKGDLVQMYKIMRKINQKQSFPNNHQVKDHCFKYFKEITRQQHTEIFFNRTDNFLEYSTRNTAAVPTLNSFKAGID